MSVINRKVENRDQSKLTGYSLFQNVFSPSTWIDFRNVFVQKRFLTRKLVFVI